MKGYAAHYDQDEVHSGLKPFLLKYNIFSSHFPIYSFMHMWTKLDWDLVWPIIVLVYSQIRLLL